MKQSIRIIVLLICLMLSGCCGGDEIMIKSTFYGGVTVTPLDVNNGDAITLKMGEFCGVISTESSVNGRNIVKSITYFIDGKEIVSSSDKDADYVATYILKDMTVGEHEITATCNPNKGVEIEEHISPARINVIK